MEVDIPNACSIVSMRELLDDPTWGPEEYCWMVYQDGGLLSEKTALLEKYAPVKVWEGVFNISGDYGGAKIANEDGDELSLSAEDKIIVCYVIEGKRSHMECIKVEDMPMHARKKIHGIVTREEDKHELS